jgi:hypothetical protein
MKRSNRYKSDLQFTLQENGIHLLVFLNLSVPMNVFKLYSSVLKLTNITLYLLVGYGNR